MIYVIAILASIGHAALCVAIVNRFHGFIVTRPVLKICDLLWYLFAIGAPLSIGLWCLQHEIGGRDFMQSRWYAPIWAYTCLCLVSTCVATIHRAVYAYQNSRTTPRLVSNHTRVLSLTQELGHRPTGDLATTWLSRIPGNEILKLSIHRKQLQLPRLQQEFEGLTITHLSDLHLTGQMSKDFYRAIVDAAMELKSDMVVVTGDIIEKERCLPWVREIFGRLQAPLGVYYVLGNHEKRIKDEASVRAALDSSGMIGLGSRCLTIPYNEREILIAGTEMPWYPPAPDMELNPVTDDESRGLRILLSHSPDQLTWAQNHRFDLMLAGHTHGGQVRIPVIGPILSPSLNGIRHAAGTFDCAPTLLHVSRGLSGTRPLRINCPPEIAQLILHSE